MKKEKGFTLVEIVIVIGIIGLLVGVLIPSITDNYQANKKRAAVIKAELLAKTLRMEILAENITDLDENIVDVTSLEKIGDAYPNKATNEDLVDTITDNKFHVKLADDLIYVYSKDKVETGVTQTYTELYKEGT